MITYEQVIVVSLDDKEVGKIRQVNDGLGWQYTPNSSNIGGWVWRDLENCKKDIEG